MKKAVIFMVALIMAVQGLMIAPVGIVEAISQGDLLEHQTRKGTTEELGGGSYLLVQLNDTMTFGIVHGDETTKAPITIFTRGMDTVAFIEQKNGTIPVRSTTFSVYKLTSLMEFNDTNKNGRLDLNSMSMSSVRKDSIVKKVNLSLNWATTSVQKKRIQNGYQWTFSLLARNVTYERASEPEVTRGEIKANPDDKTEELSTESKDDGVKPSADTSVASENLSEDQTETTQELSQNTGDDPVKPSTGNTSETGGLLVDTSDDTEKPTADTTSNTDKNTTTPESQDHSLDTSETTDKDQADTTPPEKKVSRKMVLELIRFDFNIELTREGRTEIIYTYSTNDRSLSGRESMKERGMNRIKTEGVKVDWKMDHRILGWDFEPSNMNPNLILGFKLTYGRVYESFANIIMEDLLAKAGEISKVTIPVKGMESTVWNEKANQLSPLEESDLDEGSISLGISDPNSNMYWKRGLNRTPATTKERPVSRLFIYDLDLIGPGSGIWSNPLLGRGKGVGVTITGGYTYPPLQLIVHDPGLESTGFRVPERPTNKEEPLDSIVISYIEEHTTTTVLLTLLVIIASIAVAAILTLSKKSGLLHDQELKWEKEDELFTVSRPKKNWDSLKVK